MSAYTHTGKVYFLACGRYVKIGYTTQPISTRTAHLRTKPGICPEDFDSRKPWLVIRTIPGCIIRDERRLHVLFERHHAEGEYYRLTPALLTHIGQLEYRTDREVLAEFRRARRDLKKARTRQMAVAA